MMGYTDFAHVMTKGDTAKPEFTVKDRATGAVQNIAAWTAFRLTAKRAVTDTDAQAVFAKTLAGGGITVVSAPGGVIRATINPADTSPLEWSGYLLFVDVQGIDAFGGTWTLAKGTLEVQPDTSRTSP